LDKNPRFDSLYTDIQVAFHNWLNRFGFNFYQTEITDGGSKFPVKLAVISRDNFIKGCNGTLAAKEKAGIGAFGFYVAGRMQKVALHPLYKGRENQTVEIETAINNARIDGLWFSLGLLKDSFTFDELLRTYVSLSYRSDVRIEQRGKVEKIIAAGLADYRNMLYPLLDQFILNGLLTKTEDGKFLKLESPSKQETYRRIWSIKARTTLINYLKNPASAGLLRGLGYAFQKIVRAISSLKN
jgi:hypothetical protein